MQFRRKHLAQLNVATALDDMDSERLSGFMAMTDMINAIADRSPGFVWRLQGEDGGDATSIRASDDPRFLVNLSVWESSKALSDFVWNTAHNKVYAGKHDWFETTKEAHMVFWWVEPGHIPNVEEALHRLQHLRYHGISEYAFGWESLPEVKAWQDKQCG